MKFTKQQAHETLVQQEPVSPDFCVMSTVMNILGGKWKLMVIRQLLPGSIRFGELKKRVPECSEKMLIQALRELETDQIVIRIQYNEVPPRVEYQLTDIGQQLLAPMQAMEEWGKAYVSMKMTCPTHGTFLTLEDLRQQYAR